MPKPEGLFSIGEIAVSCGLSINALRFYETKALIKPAFIDPKSGYRYFSRENLLRLRTILRLKNAGLSLPEIKDYLDGEKNAEKKIAELIKQRDLLNRAIEDMYIRTTKPGDLTVYEIELPERLCLCRTIQAKDTEHAISTIGGFYDELIHRGVSINHDWPEFCEYPEEGLLKGNYSIKDFTVTACMPMDKKNAPPEAVRYPAGYAVTVNYRGSYYEMWKAYDTLSRYIEKCGYTISGYPQEIYVEISTDDSVHIDDIQNITRVIIPIRGHGGQVPCP